MQIKQVKRIRKAKNSKCSTDACTDLLKRGDIQQKQKKKLFSGKLHTHNRQLAGKNLA